MLIDACCKSEDLEMAECLFQKMTMEGFEITQNYFKLTKSKNILAPIEKNGYFMGFSGNKRNYRGFRAKIK